MITMSPGRSVGDEDLLDIDPEALHPAALHPCNAALPTASELEYWNGAVVRLGREAQVLIPTHAHIYDCLLPQELHARGKIAYPS